MYKWEEHGCVAYPSIWETINTKKHDIPANLLAAPTQEKTAGVEREHGGIASKRQFEVRNESWSRS